MVQMTNILTQHPVSEARLGWIRPQVFCARDSELGQGDGRIQRSAAANREQCSLTVSGLKAIGPTIPGIPSGN